MRLSLEWPARRRLRAATKQSMNSGETTKSLTWGASPRPTEQAKCDNARRKKLSRGCFGIARHFFGGKYDLLW
jgi:hypothetical protein